MNPDERAIDFYIAESNQPVIIKKFSDDSGITEARLYTNKTVIEQLFNLDEETKKMHKAKLYKNNQVPEFR